MRKILQICLLVVLLWDVRKLLAQQEEPEPVYQLVACAIFQNEAFFLGEWLEHHCRVGVEHFYLFNNLSTDSYLEILQPYIDNGLVELFDWPVSTCSQQEYLNYLQLPAYQKALELARGTAKWAAFIDLDEFLVPKQHLSLVEMLIEYESYAALAVNWQVFGTSEVDDISEGRSLVESLVCKGTEDLSMNEWVKLIVQPRLVEWISNPHCFTYLPGYYAVNSRKERLEEGQMAQSVVVESVQINHYWFGTLNWFLNEKLPRRQKWGTKIPMECLEEFISMYNEVEDKSILDLYARQN